MTPPGRDDRGFWEFQCRVLGQSVGAKVEVGWLVKLASFGPPTALRFLERKVAKSAASSDISRTRGRRYRDSSAQRATFPTRGLYRPIFTRFSAEAWRVARDPAGPFCTMKVRAGKRFLRQLVTKPPRPAQTTFPEHSRVSKLDRKEKMTPIHRTASASSNGEPHLRIGRYKTTSWESGLSLQRVARFPAS
jgi:hypothetical protein